MIKKVKGRKSDGGVNIVKLEKKQKQNRDFSMVPYQNIKPEIGWSSAIICRDLV